MFFHSQLCRLAVSNKLRFKEYSRRYSTRNDENIAATLSEGVLCPTAFRMNRYDFKSEKYDGQRRSEEIRSDRFLHIRRGNILQIGKLRVYY